MLPPKKSMATSPYIWLARGDVLLALKESRADYCLEKALQLAPGDWSVLWLAARVRSYHEQFAGALQLAQRAIPRDAGLCCGSNKGTARNRWD